MSKVKTETERVIYDSELQKLEQNVQMIEADLTMLKTEDRNGLLEYQAFVSVMGQAGSFFEKLPNVQKRKILSLSVLNIIISDDMSVRTYVQPCLEAFSSYNLDLAGGILNIFDQVRTTQKRAWFRTLMDVYTGVFDGSKNELIAGLSPKQKAFYQL